MTDDDGDPAVRLTTTSYALLGQLALQDWTMYDLARQMRRNVHFFFPKAESHVYAEPKRLVAAGLATLRRESTGKRGRAVYAITQSGRDALSAWLARPPAKGFELEFEGLLRVMLAPFGQTGDLMATLGHAGDQAGQMADLAFGIRDEYLSGTAPFQRHMLHRSILHDFLTEFAVMVEDWAQRSRERVQRWESQSPDDGLAAARQVIVRAGQQRNRPQ